MGVNILEAKNTLSQLVKAAERGEEVVIANRATPVARLVPVDATNHGAATATAARSTTCEFSSQALPSTCARPKCARHGLRTPDAIHLAVAQLSGCTELWTNDDRLAAAAHGLVVPVAN